MNNHEGYALALSAFLDGELSEAERADVLAHLESCEGCRRALAELAALREALRDAEDVDVPEGFAESVMARLRAEDASLKARKRRVRRGWAAAAACAAVIALAIAPNFLRMGGANNMSAQDASAPMLQSACGVPEEAEQAADESAEDASAAANAPADGVATAKDAWPPAETDACAPEPEGSMLREAGMPEIAAAAADGAAREWLLENGTYWDGRSCLVPAQALREAPETLRIGEDDAARIAGYDGPVLVTLAETEETP